jgi:hypothetical protein
MSNPELLSVLEVREFVSDYSQNNRLLDGEEFSDTFITLCRSLAVDEWNTLTPASSNDLTNFPSKSVLLYGTLWKMYDGKAALLARNTMSYSDGGVQIAVEERVQLYTGLAQQYQANFMSTAARLKAQINMNSGWGGTFSDYSTMPSW